ncbi:Cell cycle checkpoint control protein RAD9A [Grifola frondosa]|uniref:Cell cycle checkpoint control protein RAD9A n=1 Tax=Grifola frondosa TaxID=5627 RepID=A0A1C7MFE3_GRIFR|nr:Cell cycle checkpoint control protein RAD9A [Grifola frondosa]
MQATLDSTALKHLTRALICLSKYGEDLIICATPETLALSTTNSSLSAYSRFKYRKTFFSRYKVGNRSADNEVAEIPTVTGQLLTKSLLSILKHKTVEKAAEKCELTIQDGASSEDDADEVDSLESRLIVRLHCKHGLCTAAYVSFAGVVKTHRLLLLSPNSLMSPGVPDVPFESRLTIGPKALKDMIEHFPFGKGNKSDPQLIWHFYDSEVQLRSVEASIDAKGRAQLSTELTISADEFEVYDVHEVPITIAFHLREFNATIAFAEASSLPLDIRFTDPSAPLFIDIEGDLSETLFVIATSQVQGGAGSNARRSKSAVQDLLPQSYRGTQHSARMSMHPHSFPDPEASQNGEPSAGDREPLFLPASQLSQAAEEAIRESGLGIENMTMEEFEEMLEGEGEEVEFEYDENTHADILEPFVRGDSFELLEDSEMEPTQSDGDTKTFRPLFED